MNLVDAVAARRSVRAFKDLPVPRGIVERAVELAVQAPAPHHSLPWRFVLLEGREEKEKLSLSMARQWRADLRRDRVDEATIERVIARSHALLASTPLLTVCCADMTRAHSYADQRRKLAEWSLFAHSVGAALQTFMLALAEEDVASCWISAPVFCRDVVKATLDLGDAIEPHALVLVGYASNDYTPRPRPDPNPADYIL